MRTAPPEPDNDKTTVEIDEGRLKEILTGVREHLTMRERLCLCIVIPPAVAFTIACFVFAYYMAKLSNLF